MCLLLQEVVCNVADLVVLCVFLVEKLRECPLKETNSSMMSQWDSINSNPGLEIRILISN